MGRRQCAVLRSSRPQMCAQPVACAGPAIRALLALIVCWLVLCLVFAVLTSECNMSLPRVPDVCVA